MHGRSEEISVVFSVSNAQCTLFQEHLLRLLSSDLMASSIFSYGLSRPESFEGFTATAIVGGASTLGMAGANVFKYVPMTGL